MKIRYQLCITWWNEGFKITLEERRVSITKQEDLYSERPSRQDNIGELVVEETKEGGMVKSSLISREAALVAIRTLFFHVAQKNGILAKAVEQEWENILSVDYQYGWLTGGMKMEDWEIDFAETQRYLLVSGR